MVLNLGLLGGDEEGAEETLGDADGKIKGPVDDSGRLRLRRGIGRRLGAMNPTLLCCLPRVDAGSYLPNSHPELPAGFQLTVLLNRR
jgi:hypothetical protein